MWTRGEFMNHAAECTNPYPDPGSEERKKRFLEKTAPKIYELLEKHEQKITPNPDLLGVFEHDVLVHAWSAGTSSAHLGIMHFDDETKRPKEKLEEKERLVKAKEELFEVIGELMQTPDAFVKEYNILVRKVADVEYQNAQNETLLQADRKGLKKKKLNLN